ncbi:hypothetical protein [Haloplanus halobius]|uniref:DUF5789 family protein n=1 Tax=Haloplanus halobius TaxID=2934938 RepID=UPI002010A754|nr:hypothetical protein [Haloplanus sp. XH21]
MGNDSDDRDPDPDERRQHELSEHVESILEETECIAEAEHKFPVRREELAADYADHMMDLPNETESLGSVFDRLTARRYETPAEAREAVINQLTGEEGGMGEYNDQRSIEQLARDVEAVGALENDGE